MRKKYFVNFSVQFKYIMMSVLPSFINEPVCIYFVIQSGELLVEKQKSKKSLRNFLPLIKRLSKCKQSICPKMSTISSKYLQKDKYNFTE